MYLYNCPYLPGNGYPLVKLLPVFYLHPPWSPLSPSCVNITLVISPQVHLLIKLRLPPLSMLTPNSLEVRTNKSYESFNVTGCSSLPTKAYFLISSNSCTYLDLSARSKNNIALNFSSLIVIYYGRSVAPNLSIVFKMHIICSPPSGIKFCSQDLNLSKYSSFVSISPLCIFTNNMSYYIRKSLGFYFTYNPDVFC